MIRGSRRLLTALTLVLCCCLISSSAIFGAVAPPSPIERAINFLFANQVTQPVDMVVNGARIVDFPGDWPQFFNLRGAEAFRVRDVSPFTVAFIHHALTLANQENRKPLDLNQLDLQIARAMRLRAV